MLMNQQHELKQTDSGRQVYGGGGITPDVKIPTPKANALQDRLLQHYAFFNFAKRYLVGKHIQRNFEVTDDVLQDFRAFLQKENIQFTEQELSEVNDWVKSNIKSELFISEFGQQAGLAVRAETDPEVIKAIDLLPQAKALAENAKKIVAEKMTRGFAGTASR